jgi:hypothetical protein
MIKSLIVGAGAALAISVSTAQASEPCKSVLCLYGELTGTGGDSTCKQAIADYFSIRVFVGEDRTFSPGRTKSKRMQFLNGCSENTTGEKEAINQKFGGMFSL